MTMTVGELRQKIADLPDDMPVFGKDFAGLFGIDAVKLHTTTIPMRLKDGDDLSPPGQLVLVID